MSMKKVFILSFSFFVLSAFVLIGQTVTAPVNANPPAVEPGGADVAFQQGNFKRAEAICRAELKLNVRNFNAWFYLCQSLLQQGLYGTTQANCKTALQYFPTSSSLHEVYGASLFYGGNYNNAMEEYSYAIKNAPTATFRRSITWYHLGIIYISQQKYNKAVAALQTATRSNPSNMIWKERYGFALDKAGVSLSAVEVYKEVVDSGKIENDLKVKIEERLNELAPQTFIESPTVNTGSNP